MKITYLNTNNGVVIAPTSQKAIKRAKKAKFMQILRIGQNTTLQKAISPKKTNFYIVKIFDKEYMVFDNLKLCSSYLKDELYIYPSDFVGFKNEKDLINYINNN